MSGELSLHNNIKSGKKRKSVKRKGAHMQKEAESYYGVPKVKNNKKMKKLFQKRMKEYNSDDNASDCDGQGPIEDDMGSSEEKSENDFNVQEENRRSDEEDDYGGEIQKGITKFSEGCKAFRVAFIKILNSKISSDDLGPILSGNKKLVVEKLAEEEIERKAKVGAKKEKQLLKEKGHVKPQSLLDTHEKFLISVATKGVVKLFNAVNKAQSVQKGLHSSKSKDVKDVEKQTKQIFLSELRKSSTGYIDDDNNFSRAKGHQPSTENTDVPGWAPLQDNYMLTNPKWKDWDK